MAKNVIGLFDDPNDAASAVRDLQAANIASEQVSQIRQASPQLSTIFEQIGVPQDDAAVYMQGVQDGGAIVVVQQLGDDEAERAVDILDRYHAVDIDQRMRSGRATSTTMRREEDTNTTATVAGGALKRGSGRRATYEGGEQVIPIVEEELHVGKREVEGGGVRVRTSVEERPVNEQVTLRDEEVHVERRRVDQPLDAAAVANAFQEGTIEVRERDEQAIVQKEARIVEEVVINKQAQDRTETIQDTVRRTNVDVQELPGEVHTTDATGMTTTGVRGGSADEGSIERGLSKAENAAERGTGLDLDRDGDVGQRDPRNNI